MATYSRQFGALVLVSFAALPSAAHHSMAAVFDFDQRFSRTGIVFQLDGPLPGNPKQWKNVSADGSRFVFVTTEPVNLY